MLYEVASQCEAECQTVHRTVDSKGLPLKRPPFPTA
jgi:hypothetical protein